MIKIQDNTIRDGMQQRNVNKNFNTKLKILDLLKSVNIDSLEVGMCSTIEDFNLLSEISNHLSITQKMVVLTRLVHNDIVLACKLVRVNKNLVIKLLFPISDLHITKKLHSTKRNMLEKLKQSLNYICNLNINVSVCLEDATRADEKYLIKVLEICKNYTINFITISDTVGCSTPEEYGRLIRKICNYKYPFEISVHCHNDLGLATANTIAGVLNGATQVETTFLGIGERAGNCAIDEILYLLTKKYNIKTDLDLKRIFEISKELEDLLNYKSSPLKPIIGENAFVHESGIHHSPISGLSSSKIISSRLQECYNALTTDDIYEIDTFYKTISKITNNIIII